MGSEMCIRDSSNIISCPIPRHCCSGVKRPHRLWRANHIQYQPLPLRYLLCQIKPLRAGPAMKQSSIRLPYFALFGRYYRFNFGHLVPDPAARLDVFGILESEMTLSRNFMWSSSRRVRNPAAYREISILRSILTPKALYR